MSNFPNELPEGFAIEAYALHQSFWGKKHLDRLTQQAMEEAGELLTGLSHWKRGRSDFGPAEAHHEIADLLLCLIYLNYFMGYAWSDLLISAKAKEIKMVAALYREVQGVKACTGGIECPECSSPICERVTLEDARIGWQCRMCGLIHHIAWPIMREDG